MNDSRQGLHLKLKTDQRMALLGRMRMADWIEMPEKEFIRELAKVEKDPLFKKLFLGLPNAGPVIRRQRWKTGRMSGNFYPLKEQIIASSGNAQAVENLLDGREKIMEAIRRMGRENFELWFLRAEESIPLEELIRRTGLTREEISQIHDFLIDLDIHTQFSAPLPEAAALKGYSCLGRLALDGSEPYIEFTAAYWGRGLYHVSYEQLEKWRRDKILEGTERKRLRSLIKKIETLSLRQNTIYRVLESLSKLQKDYLGTRDRARLRPISLRLLARRLQLAPSTISRAASRRSVRLPWGPEIPIMNLMPGQRKTLEAILALWKEKGEAGTDGEWADRLRKEYGIAVSRRTVNAVRHSVNKSY